MATLKQIQFKRSKTAGARPAASVLAEGELAINLKDRTIFTKDDSGNIIDLSISAGGNISGNITQTGDYLQNGTYNLNGNQFVYAGKYIEFLPKTAGNGAWANQHKNKAPIFTDLSSTTSTSEYHPLIKQRYKDGTFSVGTLVNEGSFKIQYINESGDSKYWTFNRNGSFIVDNGSIEVRAGNISASGNINSATGFVSAPRVNTKNINLSSKTFIPNNDTGYDIVSLPTWIYNPPADGSDRDTNGLNYMRKMRASNTSSIFHEIVDCRSGKPQEISWWTGVGPSSFQWAFDTTGRITAGKSISVGLPDSGTNGRYPLDSAISIGIAIGDNDTGIKWVRDGVYDLMANGISSATILNNGINSTKKLMVGYSRDSGSTWDFPNNNQAMFTARTDIDGNNNGDGQTHIGYNSNSKMYHYFRGTGRMAVGMSQGLLVEPGILDINTGSNRVAIRADGTFDSTRRISMRTGLFLSGDDNTNALSFKAPTGVDGTKTINWDAGTRNGQNKNTVSIKAWGNAFNSVPGIRETVFEVYDSQGYYFYSQRQRPEGSETVGPVVTQFNGPVNANGSISTAGNLKVDGLSTLNGNVTMKNGLFVQGGSSITGQVKIGGTSDALRIWNAEYGAIFRRSEDKFYIIPTPQNAGESGGISNLRPFYITLSNGKVSMDHDVDIGGGRFKVEVAGTTAGQRITVNASSDAIRINAPTQESSNFIQGRKADVPKWYLGIGDGGNVVRMHSYTHSHGIALNSDSVDITKPLKVGNAQLGTDGNITNGSGNFANLNTTLNRKVNSGFITYGATSGWYKFATVTMPQSTSTVFFKIAGGSGFNSGLFTQCNIAEIILRTGNERPADLNAVLYTRTSGLYSAAFRNIAVNNVSGNTYDIYVYAGTYCNQLACEWSCTENATVSVIGINSSTQSPVDALPDTAVNGQVANVLNNLVDRGKVKRYVAESEIAINNQTGIRITSNSDRSGSNSALFRNDGGTFYILLTDKNASDGDNTATEGGWNGKRPFSIDMTAGTVRLDENTSFGKDVTINGNINSRVKVAGQWSTSFGDISDVTRDRSAFLANTGSIPKTSQAYYPLFSGYSLLTDAGYRQSFEFGWLGVPGTWRQGMIRMRGDSASGQQARWTFDMDGTFYTPKLTCGSTGALGVNTSNGFGGNSIVIGDSDTGFRQVGDGLLEVWTNAARRMRFQTGDTYSDMNINAPNVYIRSDIRLKSNFRPIENALEKVEQLDGLIYDKADYIGGEIVQTEAGIVAQTLQDVLPEAVREVEDIKGNKILTVSSQAQIALLVEAVKTLSARVKELESKLM
ncbi:tail fiber protein [Escherichia phage KIT06]|nr:tail fiber protein [Escherichia phage KIT06]